MKKICLLLIMLVCCVGCTDRSEKLIMVTEASFAPYEYYSDGKITGVDVEIAKEIAKEMGIEEGDTVSILNFDFDYIR